MFMKFGDFNYLTEPLTVGLHSKQMHHQKDSITPHSVSPC